MKNICKSLSAFSSLNTSSSRNQSSLVNVEVAENDEKEESGDVVGEASEEQVEVMIQPEEMEERGDRKESEAECEEGKVKE